MILPDKKLWMICKIIVLILIGVTFSPMITPENQYLPEQAGIPYTLWTGIILAIVLVGITWFATKVHPGREE